MLIVEGTDNVGKTTLCEKLLERLKDHKYGHFTVLPPTWQFPEDYLPHIRRDVVMDRFHMSEIVYCKAAREGRQLLKSDAYRWVDGQVRLVGGFTVIITASVKFLKDRHSGDGQMFSLPTHLAANRGYELITTGMYALYAPDFDYHIHLVSDWPADAHVEMIVQAYLRRQESLPQQKSARL